MKSLKFYLIVLLVLLVPGLALAAGSWTTPKVTEYGNVIEISATFTADSSDGSVPDLELTGALLKAFTNKKVPYYLYRAITDPGTPSPTDNYDITVDDANGNDMAAGKLENRDETNTEIARMAYFDPVRGKMTVTVSNNSDNSATGELILIFVP